MRKQEIKRKKISNRTSNNKATSYGTLLFWQRNGLDNYSFRSAARYIYGNMHFSEAARTVGSKWTRARPPSTAEPLGGSGAIYILIVSFAAGV